MSDAPSFDILDDAACQRALAVLVEIGTSIAKELKTPSKDISITARAAAFDRVALAIRRTIILSRHIAQYPTKPVTAPLDPDATRTNRRKQIIRAVEETIGTKADPAEAPALRVELLERIDSAEFDAELTHRSPGEIIAELCRDLGLANIPGLRCFPRRTPDDIAILCAQAAAAAGSGLPRWLAIAPDEPPASDPPPTTTQTSGRVSPAPS